MEVHTSADGRVQPRSGGHVAVQASSRGYRLVVALAAALLLSACGGPTTSAQGSRGSTPTLGPNATAVAPRTPMPITMMDNHSYKLAAVRVPNTPEPPKHRRTPVRAKVAAPAAAPEEHVASGSGDIYDKLADCETGSRSKRGGRTYINWGTRRNANTGNGYYGYFQFKKGTWNGMGMSGYPHHHSYEVQKNTVKRIPLSAWRSQFPSCTKILRNLGVL